MAVFSKLLKDRNEIYKYSNSVMWNVDDLYPYGGFLSAFSTVAICVISYYMLRWLSGGVTVEIREASQAHNWKDVKITAKSWYCSICEELLIHGIGVYCDYCGVCSDPMCIKKANKQLPCKIITSKNEIQEHHWVKGNLPLGALCEVCDEDCAVEPGLVDYRCCWCNRTVHEGCLRKLDKVCDFGPFKNLLVPPWCVQLARRKSAIHRHMLLRGVKDPGWNDWCPLIVVANRKSGNNDGDLVLSEFRRYLNPAQVLDLAERSPAAVLQWSILIAPKRINLLVAGGDGTVAWVLTSAHQLDLEPDPAVGIIPLGTGNDLSRVLRWGSKHDSDFDVPLILTKVQNAEVALFDRWGIEILPYRHLSSLGIRMPMKNLCMYNYLSIGVDAQVALNFHKTRDSRFYLFGSRVFNKLLYLCFGTQQVVTADCKNLQERLKLILDGKEIELPELESVVVLNISSWGAGVDLWGFNYEDSVQSYNDGILEVLGIYSSFHIAQLQVGLSKPHRIGRARRVEIHLKGKAPIQVDGEPWEQQPAQIKISLLNQATVLVNKN